MEHLEDEKRFFSDAAMDLLVVVVLVVKKFCFRIRETKGYRNTRNV